MVGVIFLLYNEPKFDREVIEKLLENQEQYGFILILLTRLTNKQLLLFKEDSPEAQKLKQQVMQKTNDQMKRVKKEWYANYILYPVYFKEQLDLVLNRTYYMSLKFETPILERFKFRSNSDTLEEFAELETIVVLT